MEFLRDKVRGKKEALSSGAGSPLSSQPLGLPGPSWGAEVGIDAVMPTITTVPTPARQVPEHCFCSPGWGVSPCQHRVLPAWLWWQGGGPGWCRAGLGPRRTGSWGEQGRLSTASCPDPWTLLAEAFPSSLVGQRRGQAERAHLQGDGGFWLCRNSVLSSARSPGPGGPLPSFRHTCSSCFVVASRATAGASSGTGSGAPRRLGSCRDSTYSSEKLLGGGRSRSGRNTSITSPTPSCARGSLPGGGELSKLSDNTEKYLPGYWPFVQTSVQIAVLPL